MHYFQNLYYFYVLCYKTGLQTVSLFRKAGVFLQELARFLFIRLLAGTISSTYRAIKAVIKRAYYKGVTLEKKQITRQISSHSRAKMSLVRAL